jgi:hypothetical protein
MLGRVRRQPPRRLLQLPSAADGVAPAGLVPRDDDVDEPLVEVALLRGGRPPGELELLVRLEVPPGSGELEPGRKRIS